jgi:hypothetical protein
LFAAIIASRSEQLALFAFSSTVVLTVMEAAKAGVAGRATTIRVMIRIAVKNLLVREESLVMYIVFLSK